MQSLGNFWDAYLPNGIEYVRINNYHCGARLLRNTTQQGLKAITTLKSRIKWNFIPDFPSPNFCPSEKDDQLVKHISTPTALQILTLDYKYYPTTLTTLSMTNFSAKIPRLNLKLVNLVFLSSSSFQTNFTVPLSTNWTQHAGRSALPSCGPLTNPSLTIWHKRKSSELLTTSS